MSATKITFSIALGSVFVTLIVINFLAKFYGGASSETLFPSFYIALCSVFVYVVFLSIYFVKNEGRNYTISSFVVSVLLSVTADLYYDSQIDSWLWNNYVLEDALISSIRPPIILLVVNEFLHKLSLYLSRTIEYESPEELQLALQPFSMRRIGLIASLPICVTGAIGLFILIPILFFILFLYLALRYPLLT